MSNFSKKKTTTVISGGKMMKILKNIMLTETIIQEDVEKNVLESIFSTKLNCFQSYNGKNNQNILSGFELEIF